MASDTDPKPARKRRRADAGAAAVLDSQRCYWLPGRGWQPLGPGDPVPADAPSAWCTQTTGHGWQPLQPPVANDTPAAWCVWRAGEGWQPAQPDHPPATAAAGPGAAPPPTARTAAGPAVAPAGSVPPSGVAASTAGLPPEVAAFYALLFTPLAPPAGPEAAPGESGAPNADASSPTLWDSFRSFTARLGDALNQFVTNVSSLEVDTYTSTNPATVHLDPDPRHSTGENLALLARTLVAFDGDTQLSLPAQRGAIDPALVQLHLQMVHEAQYNRAQFLRTMADLGSQLLGVFKPQ